MTMLTLNLQSDLFEDSSAAVQLAEPGPDNTVALGEPIAVPCGFVDRMNNRCRRLGHRPVVIEGVQLVSHGRPMLHCEPGCFSAFGPQRPTSADTDWP